MRLKSAGGHVNQRAHAIPTLLLDSPAWVGREEFPAGTNRSHLALAISNPGGHGQPRRGGIALLLCCPTTAEGVDG